MDNHGPTPKMTEDNPEDTNSSKVRLEVSLKVRLFSEEAKDTDNRTSQDGTDDASSACLGNSGSNRKRKVSDSENPNTKKLRNEIKVQEETHFINVIENVKEIFKRIENSENFDESLEIAIREVIDSFKYREGNKYQDIDYTKPIYRLAYFVYYGSASAGVVRLKIANILEENENIRNVLKNFKSNITILDLGTGHGCGTMGLYSSLNKYLQGKGIHLTLVDHVIGWRSVFSVVEYLLELKDFGKASDFFRSNNVSTNYLDFDISKKASEHKVYETSLNEADIILISRVLSIEKDLEQRKVITQNVVKGMKSGALLFFIDAMGKLGNPFENQENIELIASEENKYYEFEGSSENNLKVSKICKAMCFVYRKK